MSSTTTAVEPTSFTTLIAAAITEGRVKRAEGERLLAHLLLVAHGVRLDHLLTHATYYRRLSIARRLGLTAPSRQLLGPVPVT